VLRDASGNGYGDALDINLTWNCDGTESDPITYFRASSFELPEGCTDLSGTLHFPTTLNDTLYSSTLTFPVQDTNAQRIETIVGIGVMRDGYIQPESEINRIDDFLAINVSPNAVDFVSAEIKLGDDTEWQPLVVNQIWYPESIVLFDLPMLFGDHVMSLRVTLPDGAVQTLNHFTALGSEAGSGNDVDGDGIPNDQDDDNDNDGVNDIDDVFPLDFTEWSDTDNDGIGNNTDEDDDNDGVLDVDDAFPLDPAESVDTDNDGIGNNADDDDDNDGVVDADDAFPLDVNEQTDTDGDGVGNNADNDDDGDGVPDVSDAYPLDPSRSQPPTAPPVSESGGGGSMTPWLLLLTAVVIRQRRRRVRHKRF
jgi:hypothetical protein